jgi:hypothetical protein
MHPSIVDGKSLVVLRQCLSGFSIVEKGVLEFDGSTLYLTTGVRTRTITDAELSAFQIVRADSKIAACHGFDLFLSEQHVRCV